MQRFILSLFLSFSFSTYGQYAPQAGVAGSTAVSASSASIVGWASDCQVTRGYMNIANTSLGYATAGTAAMATGNADGSIVSLGDSGIAVLTFPHPLYDGPGPDFAVFENGFADPANSAMAFLELAYVEVSSDGTNFFRFPATSNTQVNTQIPGSGVYMDATLINNLAGKYIGSYGTPFDLDELSGTAGLNVNAITHIRLIDVTGSISGHIGTDHNGHPINDPYPTDFPTGGFDLDAVAALHEYSVTIDDHSINRHRSTIFPNPSIGDISFKTMDDAVIVIRDITGATIEVRDIYAGTSMFSASSYPAGVYSITFQSADGQIWVEKFVKL